MNKDVIDTHLDGLVARQDVPFVTAVVCSKDAVLYEGAFGQAGGGRGARTDTVGAIMSMTKAITGTAVLQLVEQGRLDLDAPAGEVCGYLGEVKVLTGFDDAGEPQLRAPTQPVTLRNLLTHSSGFAYDIWNTQLSDYIAKAGVPSMMSRKKVALELPLMFDPGARWEYGIGIDWAGLMLEEVTGVKLGEYFAEHVTGPLGMASTAFEPDASMAERMSDMSFRQEDGGLVVPEGPALPPPDDPEFEMGGGGLLSSVEDYARFLRMILNGGQLDGENVLQAETVELMARNNMGDLRVEPLPTAAPSLSEDAEFFPGDEKSWGLTFQINEQPGWTGRAAGTLMWAGLSNCYYWIDRKNDLAGVYLTQLLPFADKRALDGFYEFERLAYASATS